MNARPALLLCVFLLSTGATIRDLGTLPGGGGSVALAINNSGQVVGSAFNAAGLQRAVLFDGSGSVIEIPTPYVPGTNTEAADINDAGVVVGSMGTPLVSPRPFAWSGGSSVTDLGIWSASGGAAAINNAKEIAGQSNHAGSRAVKWPSGWSTMNTLNTFGGALDYASDISDTPRIVGSSRYSGGPRHAALWDDKKLIDLGTLGGNESGANALVVRAWPDWHFTQTFVVGSSTYTSSWADVHAFRWTAWSMTDLGTLPGWYGSIAHGINKNLDVVGFAWDSFGGGLTHAVIWRGGAIEDLNTWISDPDWELQVAYDINDPGQIVGQGVYKGQGRAFLLEP
jgi:probable HAF family extracellular repeat protein